MCTSTTNKPSLDGRIEKFLDESLQGSIVEVAKELVGRFCIEGQVAISSLLVFAHEAGKLSEALAILGQHWDTHYQFQHP